MTQNQINNVSRKTLAIKARVYNHIRTALYRKRLDQITDQEKIAFFDQVFQLNNEAHWELNDYKQKRKQKAKIALLRSQRNSNIKI